MREIDSAASPNLQWLFESHLPRRIESHPELVEAARSSFRFVISGEESGTWLVDLRAGQARVVPGSSGGLCTVTTSAATLAGIAYHRVNPRSAWEEGLLRAEGELEPAMLATLLHLLQVQEKAPVPAAAQYPLPALRYPAADGGEFVVATLRDRPDLLPVTNAIVAAGWPEFMLRNSIASRCWKEMYEAFPDLQFALLDATTEEVVAVSASAALVWNPDVEGWPEGGWEWALARAIEDHRAGRLPNAQCGLMITMAPGHRGKGASTKVIQAMKALGQRLGLNVLGLPVRPSLKSQYPLIPIERYITWRRSDGRPFDPWIRAHTSLGAEIIGLCLRSTVIEGSVREWEEWTKMQFPDSGSYVVPGGLVAVEIDKTLDRGVYLEPNVWMRHWMTE
jgi:GNAT superfamily N-acetyltransferase